MNTRNVQRGEPFETMVLRTPVRNAPKPPVVNQGTYTKEKKVAKDQEDLIDFDKKSNASHVSHKSRQSQISHRSALKSLKDEARHDANETQKKIHQLNLKAIAEEKKLLEIELEQQKQKVKDIDEELEATGGDDQLSCDEKPKSCHEKVKSWLDDASIVKTPTRFEHFESSKQQHTTEDVLIEAFKALKERKIRDLPSFNGDLMDWPNFISEFRRATTEYDISDSENLRRLDKALNGPARDAVKGLLNSPRNVGLIIRMLETNFGQPRWVMMQLMERARNLNPVKESLESYRDFFNNLTGIVNGLKDIDAKYYLTSPELLTTLVDKLPNNSRMMWGRRMSDIEQKKQICSIEHFCDWFRQELQAQYATYNPARERNRMSMNRPMNQQYLPNKPIHTQYKVRPQPVLLHGGVKECCLCGEHHENMSTCEKFKKLPIRERRQTARDSSICFLCLEHNHNVKNCTLFGKVKCSTCNCNHHDLLHAEDLRRRSQNKVKPTENVYLQAEEKE